MPEDTPQPRPAPQGPGQGARRRHRQAREAVTWAFRLFLGRDPKDEDEVTARLPFASLDALRAGFIRTPEFQAYLDTLLPRARPRMGVPTSLLRPPLADIPWLFEPPTMEKPVSQLCTASQFDEPAFAEVMTAMGLTRRMHRRLWQHVYVVSVFATLGCIGKGRSAIGLGVTRDRIAALLASRGVEVMAMGRPGAVTPEEARGGYHLFFPEVVRIEDFDLLVHFAEADLTDPELDLGGPYDMCWSCATAQHMGGMDKVLGLVEGSLNLLKPGGVAVHTMDFNVGSDADTVETKELTIPRRRDIEALVARLVRAGHEVLPLNLYPGHDVADGLVDMPPYGLPHLKLQVGDHVVTSVGIAVRRGG
jgi:hypothetical protein